MKIAPSATPVPLAPLRYDTTSMRLHWLTATLVLLMWCLGQTIDWFPRGAPRITPRSVHISFGVLLTLVLAYRIWWRVGFGRRLPPADARPLQGLATLVQYGLYVLLTVTLLLGFANVWVRGDTIYNLFTVPAFDPGNKPLRHRVEDLHALLANTVLVVAGVHALAALIHHYVWKDGVLRRMLAGR